MPVDLLAELDADSPRPLRRISWVARPGSAALLLAPRVAALVPPRPLIAGGGQERGWRGGTPGTVAVRLPGFAAAAGWRCGTGPCAAARRDRAGGLCRACGAVAAGRRRGAAGQHRPAWRWPLVAAQTPGDEPSIWPGFAVSAGAACSSGKVSRSHVLDAMGLGPNWPGEAIRVSAAVERADHGGCRRRSFCRLWRHGAASDPVRRLARRAARGHIGAMQSRPTRSVYLDNQATTAVRPARGGGDAAVVHRATLPIRTASSTSMGRAAEDGGRGGAGTRSPP